MDAYYEEFSKNIMDCLSHWVVCFLSLEVFKERLDNHLAGGLCVCFV